MEILNKGQHPDNVPFTGTCHKCKSRMRAKASEISVQWDQREGCEWATGICPVCGGSFCLYPESSLKGHYYGR